MRDQVTVVIPTLDEEEAIGPLLDEVKAAGYGKILVVDGYSKDRTAEVARQKGAQVVGQHGKGKTGAVLVARDIVDTPYFILRTGNVAFLDRRGCPNAPHFTCNGLQFSLRPREQDHVSTASR